MHATNHGNGWLSETIRKENKFSHQMAVLEGNFDNEIVIRYLAEFCSSLYKEFTGY